MRSIVSPLRWLVVRMLSQGYKSSRRIHEGREQRRSPRAGTKSAGSSRPAPLEKRGDNMTTSSKTFGAALSVVAVVAAAFASSAFAQVSQSGEQKNMRRIGHTDLQGRPAYQPN